MGQPVSLELLTETDREPVTLEEAKAQMRIDNTDDDIHIDRLIKGARQTAEEWMRRRIIRQKWRIYFKRFSEIMTLRPAKVREVDQIQYIDGDGVTQTLGTTIYTVDIPGQRVIRAYDQVWPQTRFQENAVWIDVWSGMYDHTASPVDPVGGIPEAVKQGILMIVASTFDQAENHVHGTIVAKPTVGAEMLLQPYKVYNE